MALWSGLKKAPQATIILIKTTQLSWKDHAMSQIAATEASRAYAHALAPQATSDRQPIEEVEAKKQAVPTDGVSLSPDAQKFSALKAYVRQLLTDQGVELQGSFWDEMSVEDAQAAIAEGGEWSAEAVADRIIGFVAETSGGNPEQSEMLREAVRQGFEEARQAFGGWLPEVSERTYDLVMERFDEAFKRAEADPVDS
jgi:hypothetical protein